MSTIFSHSSLAAIETPEPPGWVRPGSITAPWRAVEPGVHLRRAHAVGGELVSVRLQDVLNSDLESSSRRAYEHVVTLLDELDSLFPVRFWNFVPGILDQMPDSCNRYMHFNAGRHTVLEPRMLTKDSIGAIASTGVGNPFDDDLVVHCLAASAAGVAVENPRQVPAFRYSRKFGPLPPVFSRATWLEPTRQLLVSGTASVVGEDSAHEGSLELQLDETIENLDSVCSSMRSVRCSYKTLRVYIKQTSDVEAVLARLASVYPGVQRIEWLVADLCRPELLVEVEGVAGE